MKTIETAAELINSAKRPLILAGQGVSISGAEKQLREFAEKTNIPVANTLLGLSTMPSDHPLYKGMLGMHGNMRSDDRVTGAAAAYAPDAKIIHIDIDASEFDKVVPATIAVHSDAAKALECLIPLVDSVPERNEWMLLFDRCMEREDATVMEAELRRVRSHRQQRYCRHRRRTEPDDERPLLPVPQYPQLHIIRRSRNDGLRPACRYRCQDRTSGSHRGSVPRRRRLPDDHAGTRHDHAIWNRCQDCCDG